MAQRKETTPAQPNKRTIRFASTHQLQQFQPLIDEFMQVVFQMSPGSYLITDMSSLRDFRGYDGLELSDMHEKIRTFYGVELIETDSHLLVDVLARIQEHQRHSS